MGIRTPEYQVMTLGEGNTFEVRVMLRKFLPIKRFNTVCYIYVLTK